MEITHDVLIGLGFTKTPGRKIRYDYKGFIGNYAPGTGGFTFHGFTPDIHFLSDLKFMLMIIDYQSPIEVSYFSRDN